MESLFNIAHHWAVFGGSFFVIGVALSIGLISIITLIVSTLTKTTTFRDLEWKLTIMIISTVLIYISVGTLRNWWDGNIPDFFLAWVGYAIPTVFAVAVLTSLLRRLK